MHRRDWLVAVAGTPLLCGELLAVQPAVPAALQAARRREGYDPSFICPKYPYAFYATYWSYYALRYNGNCQNGVPVTYDGPPITTPVNCTLPNCPCVLIEVYDADKAAATAHGAIEIFPKNSANGQLAHYADRSVIDGGLSDDAAAPFLATHGQSVFSRWFDLDLDGDTRPIQILEFQTVNVAGHAGGDWVHVAYDLGNAAPQGSKYDPSKIKTKEPKGNRSQRVRIDQTGGSNADRDYHVYLRRA